MDVPNPVTSLTPRECKHVADSWRLVQENAKDNGVALFINYFLAFPEAQTRFQSFKGIPPEQLRSNKAFQDLANRVMYTLSCVVDHLDDPECLFEMLRKLGEDHGRRLITKQHFYDLKGVLLDLLRDKLGPAMTQDVDKSWDKTIDVIFDGIFVGLVSGTEEVHAK